MTSISTDLAYVSHIASRSPVLTRTQELELARRSRDNNDRRAADTLVRAHLRLVIVVALKYRHYGVPVSELVAEGNCGLVTALSKFEPERGLRFGTYAKHWVRAHVLASVIRASNIFGERTGLVRPQLFFKLRRERARMTALLGEGATTDEMLAQRMNISVDRLHTLLERLDIKGVPLDAPAKHDQGERFVDTLPSGDNPEEYYFQDQRNTMATSAVAVALGTLDARERYITERRTMAGGSDELSLAEIGRQLGISRERARQLEERAKRKLGRNPAIMQNVRLLEWFAK